MAAKISCRDGERSRVFVCDGCCLAADGNGIGRPRLSEGGGWVSRLFCFVGWQASSSTSRPRHGPLAAVDLQLSNRRSLQDIIIITHATKHAKRTQQLLHGHNNVGRHMAPVLPTSSNMFKTTLGPFDSAHLSLITQTRPFYFFSSRHVSSLPCCHAQCKIQKHPL